jgi:SCY1-like protein 2
MNGGGEVDFEALVGSKGNTGGSDGAANGSRGVQGLSLDDPWDRTDDWLASAQATSSTRPAVNYTSSNTPTTPAAGGRLKARPVPASTFNSAAFAAEPAASRPNNVMGLMNGIMQSTPALPPPQVQMTRAPLSPRPAGPNYNISLAPQAPTTSVFGAAPSLGMGTGMMAFGAAPSLGMGTGMMASKPMAMNTTPATAAPPGWTNSGAMGMGGVLQPTRKIEQASSKKTFNDADWGDFDPLK